MMSANAYLYFEVIHFIVNMVLLIMLIFVLLKILKYLKNLRLFGV